MAYAHKPNDGHKHVGSVILIKKVGRTATVGLKCNQCGAVVNKKTVKV